MHWIFYALIGPVCWTIANFADKFIISKYLTEDQDPGALVLFTALTGIVLFPFLFFFNPSVLFLEWTGIISGLLTGFLLVFAFIPYCKAIALEDTSSVTPLFQIIPLFSYILGIIFFQEYLTLNKTIAAVFIVAASVLFLYNNRLKVPFNKRVFKLMLLSSFLTALVAFLFKLFSLDGNFYVVATWSTLGSFLAGLLLFSYKKYRSIFFGTVRKNKITVLGVSLGSEVLSTIGILASSYAATQTFLVNVSLVNSIQPLMLFLFGIILTIFLPHIIKEKISTKIIIQKIVASLIMFLGLYLLLS